MTNDYKLEICANPVNSAGKVRQTLQELGKTSK